MQDISQWANIHVLKYKVGLNILYPKIGEIDPYANTGKYSKGTNICYSIPD